MHIFKEKFINFQNFPENVIKDPHFLEQLYIDKLSYIV